jgi:hypothetical protein
LPLRQGLVDLVRDNLEQGLVDLALTISRKATVWPGNPVKKEKDIEEDGGDKEEERKSPDDQGEEHTRQNDSLSIVGLGNKLDL